MYNARRDPVRMPALKTKIVRELLPRQEIWTIRAIVRAMKDCLTNYQDERILTTFEYEAAARQLDYRAFFENCCVVGETKPAMAIFKEAAFEFSRFREHAKIRASRGF